MCPSIDELICLLEEVNTELLRLTDPADVHAIEDPQITEVLIQRRGSLISELASTLTVNPPASYAQFNQMVVIHVQGSRIQENLRGKRTSIQRTLAQAPQQRAYLDRLDGVVKFDDSVERDKIRLLETV